jgi:hypothetical protein
MPEPREVNIRANYSYFQGVVASLMEDHEGQVALIRDCAIIAYYDTAGEAVAEGARQFGDLPFSVQRVINRPIDLGFLSHAAHNGITV